jgi:hypothetical protein
MDQSRQNSLKKSDGEQKKTSQYRFRKNFKWAATAVIAAILTLSAWAVSSPIGSSPDDDYHNVSIWCGQGFRDGLCEEGPNGGSVVSETLRANYLCFSSRPENSGACEPSEIFAETTRVNIGENPRIFYWAMSWFAGPDIAPSVIGVRIANSVIVALLFAFTILSLPLRLRRIPLISLLVTSVPLGMFIVPSTNPSSWGYSALLVLFPVMVALASTEKWRDRWVLGLLAIIALLMTAGSRADSALYAMIAIATALFITVNLKNLKREFIWVGLAFAGIGAYLFLSSGNTAVVLGGGPGGGLTFPSLRGTFYNLLRLPDLIVGAFGSWGLGWLDTPLPSSVWAVTFGIYCALVFGAIRYFSPKQSIALAFVFVSLVSIPMLALHASGLVVGQFVQPRYLLPLLGLMLAVALFRESNSSGLKLSRGQVWLIGFGLIVTNSISLHTNLRRYLTGLDGSQINLNRDIEWWWFQAPADGSWFVLSPNSFWIFGSVAFAVFLVAIWKLREEIGLPGVSNQKDKKSTTELMPFSS